MQWVWSHSHPAPVYQSELESQHCLDNNGRIVALADISFCDKVMKLSLPNSCVKELRTENF